MKFGTGNHKLRIETQGRYDHNRLGPICESNQIEDEYYLCLTGKLRETKSLVIFGTGNHKLRIETGRYDYNRLGPICESNQIEDESLFLMYCIKYSILGDEFYRKIGNIVTTF